MLNSGEPDFDRRIKWLAARVGRLEKQLMTATAIAITALAVLLVKAFWK